MRISLTGFAVARAILQLVIRVRLAIIGVDAVGFVRWIGIAEEMNGHAEARTAGAQRGIRLDVARRDVIQHDQVGADFRIIGGPLP
jgi:hypothetical protein